MAARDALAAPADHKMLWPREMRWPLLLIARCYGRARCAGRSCLIKECYGRARGAGRSNGSLTLLVACEQVICRQISWWRRSVLARADHKNSAAFVQSHTCGCYSFDCPASPEKEDQRAAGRPAALTQLALCLRLASNLRPKADNAPSTLNDSTRQ
jgi:hypothetical protein